LHDAGRLEQSQAAFDRLARLNEKQSPDILLRVSTLLGIAGLQLDTGGIEQAVQSLQRVDELRASDQTLARHLEQPRSILASRIALARGDFSEAKTQVERMRPEKLTGRPGMSYHLRLVDIEQAAGNFAAAADHARLGVQLAISLQGGLPYTKQVGAAWYRLGRAQLQLGEKDAARKAFQAAVPHLAKTVAPDHSMLLEARELARS
jgi:tetratricopeptide (TPR) repeat protein